MRGWTLVVAVMALLASCRDGRKALLPESTGRAYEALIVGDSKATDIVRSVLQEPMEGLPQQEPWFDVSVADSKKLNATLRSARCLIVTTIGENSGNSISVGYDVYAAPQVVVRIKATSAEQLSRMMRTRATTLRELLTENEMKTARQQLERRHNTEAERTVRQMFGVEMRIPEDMTSSKRGDNFLWLSNNAADGMQNICLYIYKKGIATDGIDWRTLRDSVMAANIPGEEPGMVMRTATEGLTTSSRDGTTICRGLWEMEGDMMGGPFVSLAVADTVRKHIVVAEAFVYAPSREKRNLLRQTEAALQTLRTAP